MDDLLKEEVKSTFDSCVRVMQFFYRVENCFMH